MTGVGNRGSSNHGRSLRLCVANALHVCAVGLLGTLATTFAAFLAVWIPSALLDAPMDCEAARVSGRVIYFYSSLYVRNASPQPLSQNIGDTEVWRVHTHK